MYYKCYFGFSFWVFSVYVMQRYKKFFFFFWNILKIKRVPFSRRTLFNELIILIH